MPDREGEGFLARWSRLKRTEAVPEPKETMAAPPASVAERPEGAAPVDPITLAESHAEAPPSEDVLKDLPKLDELSADTPMGAFLRKGVPEDLKRLALRRAWTLDPAIRDFVEVAENQYDWNVPGGAPGFGELDPGVDMKKLLAQATGQPLELEPGAPADERQNVADAGADQSGQDGEPARAQVEGAVEKSGSEAKPAEDAAPPPSETVALSDLEQNSAPSAARPLRRRHGGALPG